MDSQDDSSQDFGRIGPDFLSTPHHSNLATSKNSHILSLYFGQNERNDIDMISNTMSSKKASVESNGSVSSSVGSMYTKGKSVRFPGSRVREKNDKHSTSMGRMLKRVKSLPLGSAMERQISRQMSSEVEPRSRSKKEAIDSTKIKMNEQLEKVKEIVREKQKTEKLMSRMLPKDVYKQLYDGASVKPQPYENVTIYFSDIVGYTNLVSELDPMQVIYL